MKPMTIEEIAERSTDVSRSLRMGLYDVLGAVNGLGEFDRRRIAPRIQALLDSSAGMPTAFHINQATARTPWECASRKQGTPGGNDPVDCNWPVCGCDPNASNVVAALDQMGLVTETDISIAKQLQRSMECNARMHLRLFKFTNALIGTDRADLVDRLHQILRDEEPTWPTT